MLNYTHNVTLDGKYHTRYFSLIDMDKSHIDVLNCLIQNKPVPLHLRPAAIGLKTAIDSLFASSEKPFETEEEVGGKPGPAEPADG